MLSLLNEWGVVFSSLTSCAALQCRLGHSRVQNPHVAAGQPRSMPQLEGDSLNLRSLLPPAARSLGHRGVVPLPVPLTEINGRLLRMSHGLPKALVEARWPLGVPVNVVAVHNGKAG